MTQAAPLPLVTDESVSPTGWKQTKGPSSQEAAMAAAAQITGLITTLNALITQGSAFSNALAAQAQIQAKASEEVSNELIDNLEEQQSQIGRKHIMSMLLKGLAETIAIAFAVSTMGAGAVVSGAVVLAVTTLSTFGAFSDDGCIGKALNSIAGDLSSALGIQDPEVMQAVVKVLFVVALTVLSCGSTALDAAGVKCLQGVFGAAEEAATDASKAAAKKATGLLAKVLGNKAVVVGASVGSQALMGTNAWKPLVDAVLNEGFPNMDSGKRAELEAILVGLLDVLSVVVCGTAMIGGAFAARPAEQALSPIMLRIQRGAEGVLFVATALQTCATLASVGQGVRTASLINENAKAKGLSTLIQNLTRALQNEQSITASAEEQLATTIEASNKTMAKLADGLSEFAKMMERA